MAPRKNPAHAGFLRPFIYGWHAKIADMRVYWLLGALIISSILASLHYVAMADFLYWRYQWLDVPMHYLGGVTIAVFLVGFLYTKRVTRFFSLFALLVIGWEVFEYVFGIPREANYLRDTVYDLLMDTLGAFTVYAIARKTLWRSK